MCYVGGVSEELQGLQQRREQAALAQLGKKRYRNTEVQSTKSTVHKNEQSFCLEDG